MKKLFSLIILFNLISLILNPAIFADVTKYNDTTVSAFVPPRISDYQFDFIQNASPNVYNQAIIWYKITYGSTLGAVNTGSTTIVADWSDDKAPNDADLFDYRIGSATDGYGGAKPVINLAKHTITWTIPTLPAKIKDQAVTFTLTTNSNYTGSLPVHLAVKASMSNQFFTLPEKILTKMYDYYQAPPAPAVITPTPTVSLTPSPTPTIPPLPRFTGVSFTAVSQSGATIALGTTLPAHFSVQYGTTPTSLTKTATINKYTTSANVTLQKLTPHTTYYAQANATTADGQTFTSEIFTFQTATQSTLPALNDSIIVVTANNNVLLSGTQKQSVTTHPALILTVNSDYEMSYTLTKSVPLKTIDAVVQNKILGTNTFTAAQLPTNLIIPMQEKAQNLYVADLKALNAGSYGIFVRVVDVYGNIIEKKVADLKVMPHLTVYASDTGQPLADARIFLSYYNKETHSFQPITQSLFGTLTNPSYTNFFGQSNIVLPPGKYRIEENALFYNKATVDFTIGPGSGQNFPIIYLKRDPFNLLSLGTFAKDYLTDSWERGVATLQVFSSSIRIFHLIAVAILGSVVIISFLLFTLRAQIKIHHVPIFFFFHLEKLLNVHRQKYLYGSVVDEDDQPLSRVLIEIEDADTHTILTHTNTNNLGKFYVRNTFSNAIILLVTKEGFEPTTLELASEVPLPDNGLHLKLKKGEKLHVSFFAFLLRGCGYVLGLLFEMSLVLSLVLELLFFSLYGIERTIIYLLLSLINIIFWIIYLNELRIVRHRITLGS